MNKKSGVTLLEVILSISISSVLAISAAYAINERTVDIRDKASAEHLRLLSDAAQRMARDNYQAWSTGAARAITPGGADADSVAFRNYLPQNFGNNSYRQTWRVLTRPRAGGLVDVLVVTGGDGAANPVAMAPRSRSQVVGLAGIRAGQFDGGVVRGAFGAWRLDDTTGFALNAGGFTNPVLASYVFLDNNTVFNDYLYRVAVPGRPELNRMSTNLDMANNDINNARNITNIQQATFGTAAGGGQAQIRTNNGAFVIAPRPGGTIVNAAQDVYIGQPDATGPSPNMAGTGTLRARAAVFSSPSDIVFMTPDRAPNGTDKRITLDALLPNYRGVENWAVNSGGAVPTIVPKPTCLYAGIPQIITTLHANEGGITQEARLRRILPMRTRAIDNGATWQVVTEFLNPYSVCGGGPNTWERVIRDPTQPRVGTNCSTLDSRADGSFVIAQTFCYYPSIDRDGSTTQTTNEAIMKGNMPLTPSYP